jgi:capsular exopolysaccharide synthesis family protein
VRQLSPYLTERTETALSEVQFTANEPEANLRDYWFTIQKYFRLIAALFVGVVLLTALVVLCMTREYTAETTLMIEHSTPQVLNMRQVLGDVVTASYDDDYYKSQYALLQTETLAAQVIRELGLANNPYFRDRSNGSLLFGGLSKANDSTLLGVKMTVIERYLKRLTITPLRGTNLVKVSFTTPDPELSARIVNAHAQAYIRQGLNLHRAVNEEAQHFLEGKLGELKKRVEESEAALNAFGRANEIISLTDKENIVIDRLDELNKDLTKAEADRISLEAQEQLIQQRSYDSLPAVIDNDMIQKFKEQLVGLEGEYARRAGEYKPGFRALDQVGAQVAETRRSMQSEIKKVVAGLESKYIAAVSKENKLRTAMEEQKAKALQQKDASVTYNILAREANTNRQLYDAVLQRMKETGVAAQVSTSNIFVIVKGAPPIRPSSPVPLRDIPTSALLALVGGVGLAFLLESLNNTFKNPNEVERHLGLSTLAVIPDFLTANGNSRSASGLLELVRSSTRGILALTANGSHQPYDSVLQRLKEAEQPAPKSTGLIASPEKFSAVTESYRALRAALMLSRASEPPRVTLFTSALPSEGKTTTAANTAFLLAQMGERVLLIDTDLRRPRCHQVLNMPNIAGLTEVLTGQLTADEAISVTAIPKLSLLCSGSAAPTPNELLGSKKMRDTLDELRKAYDYIVVDATPTLTLSDALSLSTIVDGCILVVNAKTPIQVVRQTCSRLTTVGAKILGVVLNQVDVRGPDYYYTEHYYSYRNCS